MLAFKQDLKGILYIDSKKTTLIFNVTLLKSNNFDRIFHL